MTTEQAQSAVSLSAFVVAAVFGYRKLVEKSAAGAVAGVPQTGHFVVGFGFTFVFLSLAAQVAPSLGGMFAYLVAVGDLLANGRPLLNDVQGALKATQKATGGTSSPGLTTAQAASVAALYPAPGLGTAGLAHGAGTITPGQ